MDGGASGARCRQVGPEIFYRFVHAGFELMKNIANCRYIRRCHNGVPQMESYKTSDYSVTSVAGHNRWPEDSDRFRQKFPAALATNVLPKGTLRFTTPA